MTRVDLEGSRTGIVLGAGASRSVSYADAGDVLSPLDADFFDLLQRSAATAPESDAEAVANVIAQVQRLPYECWRSMERAFYTLHLRAYMTRKLAGESEQYPDEVVIKEFAQCVQVLLRKAHKTRSCKHHRHLFEHLHRADTIFSFNYDLVPERSIKAIACERKIAFGPSLYGLETSHHQQDLPLILKLHGSSNWKVTKNGKTDAIAVRTNSWEELDETPGYRGHLGEGTTFPIFLPFWDKRIERRPWLLLWRTAYERLRTAGTLLIWGYSLPQTDIKAQHFFTLALAEKPIRLCVIDPSAATQRRWRELLPQALFYPYNSIEHFFSAPPQWWQEHV